MATNATKDPAERDCPLDAPCYAHKPRRRVRWQGEAFDGEGNVFGGAAHRAASERRIAEARRLATA